MLRPTSLWALLCRGQERCALPKRRASSVGAPHRSTVPAMSQSAPTTPPGLPFRVVLLLATAVFINYIDRGNLATASPLLKDELGLSNSQIGVLLSAFFWSYAPLQPIAGWFAQRFDVRHVLAIGLTIWATATVLTGIAQTF